MNENHPITREEAKTLFREEAEIFLIPFMERMNKNIDSAVKARVVHLSSAPETLRRFDEINDRIARHEEEEQKHWENVSTQLMDIKTTLNGANDGLAVLNNLLATRKVLGWLAGLVVVFSTIIGGIIGVGAALKAFIRL